MKRLPLLFLILSAVPAIAQSPFATGTAALPAMARIAGAQAYPSRPIRLILGFAAGGSADIVARLIAQFVSDRIGQPVIVENRTGASSNLAGEAVARSAPDGYTLMLDASSYAVNPALFPKLPYDTEKAFRPIGVIALFPNVILASPTFAAKTLPELIAAAKAGKGGVSYASSGNGSAQHLAGALFESMTQVDMLHVPAFAAAISSASVLAGNDGLARMTFGNSAITLIGRNAFSVS